MCMKHEDVVKILKKEQGDLTLRQFAQKLGVSAGYLADIYNHKKQIGRKVLRQFGMDKIVTVDVEYKKI